MTAAKIEWKKVSFLDTIYRCSFFPYSLLPETTTNKLTAVEIINLPLSRAKAIRLKTRCVFEDKKYDHAKIYSTDN